VRGFWLPAQNRSVSTTRLGGRAELSIEYKDYEITPVADADTGRTHPERENSAPIRWPTAFIRAGEMCEVIDAPSRCRCNR
jgi:hypothetical protein